MSKPNPTDHQCLAAAKRELATHLATRPATDGELASQRMAALMRSRALSAAAAAKRLAIIGVASAYPKAALNVEAGLLDDAGHLDQQALGARMESEASGTYDETTRALEQRVSYYQSMIDMRRAVAFVRSCSEDDGPETYDEAAGLFAAIFGRRPDSTDGDMGDLWSHCCAAVRS